MRNSETSDTGVKQPNPVRADITLHLEDGRILQGAAELRLARLERKRTTAPVRGLRGSTKGESELDFSLPIRPFIKTYGARLSSGPKKLTLLVAGLSNGEIEKPISRADVEKNWSRMQSLMGGPYNGAYDTRARDQGWIDSPKPGIFALRSGWQTIFS